MAFKSKTTAANSQSLINFNEESINSSPVKHQAGFLSQAETCNKKQKHKQKVLNNSKSSANCSNSVSSRKFFKRKQQSTVSNGPSYRQHQPSHHNHQNTTST
jgi:hypothetical protein